MNQDPRIYEHIQETCVAYNLGKAYKVVNRLFEEELREVGLTNSQFAVLVTLARFGEMSSHALAEKLGSDPSTISRNMDLLERRNLVEEQVDQRDRRVRLYSITAEAESTLKAGVQRWKRAQRRALRAIGRPFWRTSRRRLKRLIGA
ncbi:MAG: MarR family winged helix-turn-helix transcriptional regulator [Alkalispirochaetaceae bacterium]